MSKQILENEKKSKKLTIYTITLIGVMTAITCVLGPLSLPIGVVPISLTNLAIFLSVFVLGWKKGTLSCLIYLLIGLVGAPVFSGFSGGIGKFSGPTGGYLVGFLFVAGVSGFFIEKFSGKIYMYVLGMVIGMLICYLLGTLWLAKVGSFSFIVALGYGVIPFLLGDAIKIAIATIVGPILRRQLSKANLI